MSLGILKHFPQVRKIIFIEEKKKFGEKWGRKRRKIFFFSWKLKIGEGKGGRYLEVKNVFFVKVKKLEKEDHLQSNYQLQEAVLVVLWHLLFYHFLSFFPACCLSLFVVCCVIICCLSVCVLCCCLLTWKRKITGQSIQMIICKRLVHQDDHLQEASPT